MSTITYIVKVVSAQFTIDDAVAPKLTFRDGDTYVFDQADSSNSGHILQFSITSNNSGASEYTTGVTKTGTPGSAGAKTTIITSTSTTDTIYYYSSGGGTHGEEFSNSGFTTSSKDFLKPIVGAEATAEKWGAMINHTIDQIDALTLTNPVITSFQYSDGASATAEKTVVGLVSVSCTTQTSTTVLVPGASLGIQVGMVVAGTGIPVGATVVSVIENTSFVLSRAATASATVPLTFGGAVLITGTGYDSILGGSDSNIAVTFDGTSATSISVNALKTIITCTPPAHAAGTITLKVTNASGLTASTDFVYDEEAIFTTAAGSLGSFIDGVYTSSSSGDLTAPIIQATDGEGSPSALTTGFERVTSASDDTVITTTIQGLTVQTSGKLIGTLSATEGTTYPFYATAKDSQNQRTAPRLFNIISRHPYPTGGNVTPIISGIYRYHVFTSGGNFIVSGARNVDYLIVAGGGGGGYGTGGGAGGAGGIRYATSHAVTVQTYAVIVGDGGAGGIDTSSTKAIDGGLSSITPASSGSVISATGGGKGGHEDAGYRDGGDGGSGGGVGRDGTGVGEGINDDGTFGTATYQGHNGGVAFGGSPYAGGGGGGAGAVGGAGTGSVGGPGGVGVAYTTWGAATSTGHNVSGVYYYAGGGGGEIQGVSTVVALGGYGGGGSGGNYDSAIDATAGTDGTGGGGGGGANAHDHTSGRGGDGGNGIVLIRYVA